MEETGAEVDIDDDGLVRIYAENGSSKDAAVSKIEEITAEAEVGKIYYGKVARIVDFGAFVLSSRAKMVFCIYLKLLMSE